VVISDHGMADGFRHAREGIFVAAGADLARGETAGTLSILRMPRLFLALVDAQRSPRAALREALAP